MPMPYSLAAHGPLHWPMPSPGVWLRQADQPDRETYWALRNGDLSATGYMRDTPADAQQPFRVDTGDEVVWLDVADPAASQALFRLDGEGRMTRLDHVRRRP